VELYVQDFDSPELPKGLEVVFGVGIERRLRTVGYRGLTRSDLLADSLRSASAYDARSVVEQALPSILRQSGNVPIFGYLRRGGFLSNDGSLSDGQEVDSHVAARLLRGSAPFLPPVSARKRAQRLVDEAHGSFAQLADRLPVEDVVQVAGLIAADQFPIREVQDYLLQHSAAFGSTYGSSWAKLVCLCDYYAWARVGQSDDQRARRGHSGRIVTARCASSTSPSAAKRTVDPPRPSRGEPAAADKRFP
jgi:hypothetical protein